MRCYICDWSPFGASLFHETLELNHYTAFKQERDFDLPSRGTNNGSPYNSANRLLEDNQGRPICEHCHQNGQSSDEFDEEAFSDEEVEIE
jgi:hypothetical protein